MFLLNGIKITNLINLGNNAFNLRLKYICFIKLNV
jgi:hypothetical protein